jgi:hypothetical protein
LPIARGGLLLKTTETARLRRPLLPAVFRSMRLIYPPEPDRSRTGTVDRDAGRANSPVMETDPTTFDPVLEYACRWLGSGDAFEGPDPSGHELAPLLSRVTGRRELYLAAAAEWFRSEQTVMPVLRRLEDSGARLWAVKGADLARSVYPFPGARTMCDVDFLVEREFLDAALESFACCGWEVRSTGWGVFTSGIVSELKFSRNGIRAELHTHPFYFPATLPGRLPGDLYEGGRRLADGLLGLGWHNALLYCILHMLTNSVRRPVWWVDLYLLAGRVSAAGTWLRFSRGAAGTGLGGAVSDLLSEAVLRTGAPVPSGVIGALAECRSGRETVLAGLTGASGRPSLTNLRCLPGWRRVSWGLAVLWLRITGGSILRSG